MDGDLETHGQRTKARRALGLAAELFVLALAIAIMFFTTHEQSAKKPLWLDEFATYYEATDPSPGNALSAVRFMDGNPPLYPLLMRYWTREFGSDELALRLPTTICLALAMLVCWGMTRRLFGSWPSILATLLVFLTSSEVLYHYSEARYYGQLLLLASLSFWLWHRLATTERPGLPWLLLHAVLQAAMVMTHTFGGLYGACALTALVAWDLSRGKRRFRVWASFPAGWLVFIPWIPSFLQQRDLGRPHGWVTMPTLDQVVNAFNYGLENSLPIAAVFCAVAAMLVKRRDDAPPCEDATPLVLLGVTIVVLPPLITIAASHAVVPVFVNRYLLPGVLGMAILIAALLSRAGLARVSTPAGRLPLVLVALFALTTPLRLIHATPPSFFLSLPPLHAEGIPVVTEDPHVYLPYHHYHSRDDYWLVVDWESALDEKAASTGVNNYKLMKAMKAHYPIHNVIEGDELLATWDDFYFIEIDHYRWASRELRKHPDWQVRHVAMKLYRATRRP